MELVIMGIMIMIATGCGSFFKRSGGNNNIIMAFAIYDDVKSDDARTTMLREEIFQEIYREIKDKSGQVTVNSLFLAINENPIRWEPFHVNLIRTRIRSYIRGPDVVIQSKVIDLKDMADIVEKILNYYYSDSLKDIVPTWGK